MRRRAAAILTALALAGWGGPAPADERAAAAGQEDYEGLPEGPGREAVYFTCTACHSAAQFSQQRMSRDDWDATLSRMVAENRMQPPRPWARTLILAYLSTHYGVDVEDWGGLPPGAGREAVFYTCQACHSLAIVLQQRLSRERWAETLHWMVEEQGMPEPEADEYARLLDYLGARLGPDTPR